MRAAASGFFATSALLGLAAAGCGTPQTASRAGRADPIEVAVTFDDLPSNGPLVPGETRRSIIDKIIATLRKHGISSVTGFVNGRRVLEQPGDVAALQEWLAAGDLLGDHTYSHADINAVGLQAYLDDIDKNRAFLNNLDPAATKRTFRYPYPEEGPDLASRHAIQSHLASIGYQVADVSIDFADWAYAEPYARCLARHDDAAIKALKTSFLQNAYTFLNWSVAAGKQIYGRPIPQVLLLHVSAIGALMLDDLLTAYAEEGAIFVTLDHALRDPAYREPVDVAPTRGDGLYVKTIEARHVPHPPYPLQPDTLLSVICD